MVRKEDVTREIVDTARELVGEVLDHLVIGQGWWASLRDSGLSFGAKGRQRFTEFMIA